MVRGLVVTLNPVRLWELLAEPAPCRATLVAQLTALSRESLSTRWPFLGHRHVGRFLTHEDVEIRALAVRCHAGATGFRAWEILVAACGDADPEVRAAGRDALQVSAQADPLRWVHQLLHADPKVAVRALRWVPRRFPRHLLFPFLADPRLRRAALEAIGPLGVPANAGALLRAAADGTLDPALVTTIFLGMRWEYETGQVIKALVPRNRQDAVPLRIADAKEWPALRAQLLLDEWPHPEVEQLFDLCWADLIRTDAEGMGPRLFEWWTAREFWQDPATFIIGASLFRAGMRHQEWTPPIVAMVAGLLPGVLNDDAIPLATRVRALEYLPVLRCEGAPEWWVALAEQALAGPFFRTTSRSLDLGRVAAFPTPGDTWKRLEAQWPNPEVSRQACLEDPVGAAALLERALDWEGGVRSSLTATMIDCWTGVLAAALAERALLRPLGTMTVLDTFDASKRLEVLRHVLDRLDDRPDAIAERECAVLAEEIMRRVSVGTVPALVQVLMDRDEPKANPLGRRLLGAVARHEMLSWALAEQGSLFGEQLVRVATATAGTGGRSATGPTRLGAMLPSPPQECFKELVDSLEHRKVWTLCDEEVARIRRVEGDALADELTRYTSIRTRGALRALLCRDRVHGAEPALAYWRMALRSADEETLLLEAMEHRLMWLSLNDRETLEQSVRRVENWTITTAVAAWRACESKEALPVVRTWLTAGQRDVADFLLFAVRQPSQGWLRSALEVAQELGKVPGESSGTAFNRRTVDTILAILAWFLGEPWGLEGPPPHPALEGDDGPNDVGLMEILRGLHGLLPASAVRAVRPLGYRMPFKFGWRREGDPRQRRFKEGATKFEAAIAAQERMSRVMDTYLARARGDEWAAGCSALRSRNRQVAVAGADLLELRGHKWARPVADALLSDPPAPAAVFLASRVRSMPQGAWLDELGLSLASGRGPPELRVRIGLGLWLSSGCEPKGMREAVKASTAPGSLAPEEWKRLLELGELAEHLLAAALQSREPEVRGPALDALNCCGSLPPARVAMVERLLRRGSALDEEELLTIARLLARSGSGAGAPILLAEDVHPFSEQQDGLALSALTPGVLESVIEAALVTGEPVLERSYYLRSGSHPTRVSWWPATLLKSGQPTALVSRLLQRLACDSSDDTASKDALEALRDQGVSSALQERLVEVLCWGQDVALQLTGRFFRIELLGDGKGLGHTYLRQRRIFVSPLPLLRGDQGGEDALRGLVIHELGHHIYQGSLEAVAVAQRAAQRNLHRLLNLVEDEHLERNLRSRSEEYGRLLSRLTAYAFQHACREVPVADLLGSAMGLKLESIRGLDLQPAREAGHVQLHVGESLFRLEGRGSSLARFVRALRMGLGNRHGDPKVAEGLALFGKRFRHTSSEAHLATAGELHRIFRDELAVLDLLRLDELLEATLSQLRAAGVDDETIQQLLQRPSERLASGRGRPNHGEDTQFEPITTVVRLEAQPSALAAMAHQVRGPAVELRRHLIRMGLGRVPVGRQLAGHRVDRARIGAALLTRDARILLRRRPAQVADLFLGVAVDCSGSMAGEGKIERARLAATMVAEACRHLPGVDLRIIGFTDKVIYDAGDARECATPALEAGGGNNDAAALWHLAQLALRSQRSARLLLMMSDGIPTECTVAALGTLVRRLEQRHRLACAQVAVEPLSDVCFGNYVEITDQDGLRAVARFGEVLAGLTQRVMGG